MADKYNLPRGWLNADFKKTVSYSPRLRLYSKPYRIYSKILEACLIADEYLIAMKLKSARQYKRDLSGVVGIVKEMRETGQDIHEIMWIWLSKSGGEIKKVFGKRLRKILELSDSILNWYSNLGILYRRKTAKNLQFWRSFCDISIGYKLKCDLLLYCVVLWNSQKFDQIPAILFILLFCQCQ